MSNGQGGLSYFTPPNQPWFRGNSFTSIMPVENQGGQGGGGGAEMGGGGENPYLSAYPGMQPPSDLRGSKFAKSSIDAMAGGDQSLKGRLSKYYQDMMGHAQMPGLKRRIQGMF